ncbi:MAG: hypothetical protein A2X93_07945 [Deltaproteobacteria bacterium GWC2_56_8]|nr:MAG: hypothetical protein A2X93_07945 [Deltaproteobacteria bacterium GWC2_56_8]
MLKAFCDYLIANREINHLCEEEMAREFLSFFALTPPLTENVLRKRFKKTVNFESRQLHGELKGLSVSYGEKNPYIIFDPKAAPANYTILHEIRELTGNRLDRCRRRKTTEQDCERFAAAALMPQEDFIKSIHDYGIDIYRLARQYRVSYTSCTIRIAVLLKTIFFLFRPIGRTVLQASLTSGKLAFYTSLSTPLLKDLKPFDRRYKTWQIAGRNQTISVQHLNHLIAVLVLPQDKRHLAASVQGTILFEEAS